MIEVKEEIMNYSYMLLYEIITYQSVSGNQVDFTHMDGFNNPTYEGGGCGAVEGWAQNNWKAALAALDCSI